jgi:hypothetical protein
MQRAESVTYRLCPDISSLSEAVLVNSSGTAAMLLPKYVWAKSPFTVMKPLQSLLFPLNIIILSYIRIFSKKWLSLEPYSP